LFKALLPVNVPVKLLTAGLVLVTVIAALALTAPLPERLLRVWALPRVSVPEAPIVMSPETTPAPLVISDPALTVVVPA
jgi:hypothetical protein